MRERAIIFAAASLMLIALVSELLLAPLQAKQKVLSDRVVQQQERTKELQAQLQALVQAKSDDEHSPLRMRREQLRQQLQEQGEFLQDKREHLVQPDKMADMLGNVLKENGQLQLVELKTLPVSLLIDKPQSEEAVRPVVGEGQRQIFKHGVQIAVRGNYLELMRYANALEKLPGKMFWGEASFSVERYPEAVLRLTVYTLSLDQAWLTI